MIARVVLRNDEEYWVKVGDIREVTETIHMMIQAGEGPAFFHFDNVVSPPGTILMQGFSPRPPTNLVVALDRISHIEAAEENNVPRSI